MNFYNKHILSKLLNAVMNKPDKEKYRPDVLRTVSGTVLEIGFGSGLNLPYYKNVKKLYALDPSEELYTLAQERIQKISFPLERLKVTAEKIPLDSNTADTVVSTWTLCSIPHPDAALKEVFRVLKPGGKFVFIEHGKSSKNFVALIQTALTPIWKHVAGGCHLNKKIDALISEAGFEIQKLETFQQKSQPLDFMFKGVAVAKKL